MHKHHVIPRHEWKVRFGNLRGFNAPDNIVNLTIDQHTQAHQLLFELNHSEYDLYAAQALSRQIGKEEVHRRVAAYVNIGNSNRLGKGLGLKPWNKGKTYSCNHSPEALAKLRAINTGENHPQYGTKRSLETRHRLSIANSKPYDAERRARKLELVRSPEHREKMRQARLRFLESQRSI
jgi:hypothetical protein